VGRYDYIYVYDVRNGQAPVGKSTKLLGAGIIQDVKVDGLTRRLYAVVDNGASSYLAVFDTSNITNLVEIGRVTVPGNPRRIEVVGDKAYIAVKSGMVVVSLSRLGTAAFGTDGNGDGRADDVLSYILTGGEADDVGIRGGFAYVANGPFNYGLKVIDIADPALPEEAARMSLSGDALQMKIVGDYLYLASGSKGLMVIRLY
jgi:hypothetical protein